MSLLTDVLKLLAAGETLPAKYKDHALTGNYGGCRECHILPDWLLVYEIYEESVILYLTRLVLIVIYSEMFWLSGLTVEISKSLRTITTVISSLSFSPVLRPID